MSNVSTPRSEMNQDGMVQILEAELTANKATTDRLKNENQILSSELMAIKEELRKQRNVKNCLTPTKGAVIGISGFVSVETFNSLQKKYNEIKQKLVKKNDEIIRLNAENK